MGVLVLVHIEHFSEGTICMSTLVKIYGRRGHGGSHLLASLTDAE